MSAPTYSEDGVTYLDDDQAARKFERIVQAQMGTSTEAFLARWDSGEFEGLDWDEVDGLRRVAMAIPLVRD